MNIFMLKIILSASAALLALSGPGQAAADEARPVVFAPLVWNGPFKGLRQWKATGDYLARKIGRPVQVRPLEFKEVLPAVEAGDVDFFTADPAMFATARTLHGAEAVLTMKNADASAGLIGAVIFTAAANKAVNGLTNLHGKKFGAVRRWSFAGWQMAEKEFRDAGLDVYSFVHTLRFFETPLAVIKAVRSGVVDAGTVPTGLLEREAEADAELRLEDFKILERKFHPDFPYACSTALYPGFLLAKTAAADKQLAAQVAAALKELRPEGEELSDAGLAGWVEPLDYAKVAALQEQLKGGLHMGMAAGR